MKFYDREEELALLERLYSRKGADLVIVSGRRRIGKTRLISEFLKDKKAVSVTIVPKEEKQVAKDIEEAVKAAFGYSPSFSSVKGALEYIFEQDIGLVCFDEFSNVLQVGQAIPYEVQALWDRYREKKEVLLVVSGSYVGMMNRLFTAKKAPLFNRATNTLNLKQLSFGTVAGILEDFGISSPSEAISFFCVFGGVPYYYLLLERQGKSSFDSAVGGLFFDIGAQLRDEGENVLRQEFGNAYGKYYAILDAINSGYASMNEISQKLGLRSTTLAKYLSSLQKDFRLVERIVPFGENPARSKKGTYFITDNALAFWFGLVYGRNAVPSRDALCSFIGRRFEFLCRSFLVSFLEKRGENVLKAGKWWGAVKSESGGFVQREIDVVVETNAGVYLGECKWTEEVPGESELTVLKEASGGIKTKKPVTFVFFSKNGFAFRGKEGLLLFDAKDIVKAQSH